MNKLAFIITLFFVCSVLNTQAQQTINSKKSFVKFNITGGGFFKVKGTFTGMQGTFNLDTNSLEESNFNICIAATTINTKNKKRDAHLRDPDFFNVEKYPEICFTSSTITKTANSYITKGELTLHGVTKTVEIPFTFTNNTFKGNLIINRFDYKLGEDFGTFRVGKEAKITIECVVN
ncbi:MAG: YceI family protein [Oceanihabitans sp.]